MAENKEAKKSCCGGSTVYVVPEGDAIEAAAEAEVESSGGEKHRHRTDKEKRCLMNRLKRIEGQVRGIEGMLEKDAYCPDILVQVSAVNSALNSFNKELLAQHIKNCVVTAAKNDDEATIDELVKVIQKIMK